MAKHKISGLKTNEKSKTALYRFIYLLTQVKTWYKYWPKSMYQNDNYYWIII